MFIIRFEHRIEQTYIYSIHYSKFFNICTSLMICTILFLFSTWRLAVHCTSTLKRLGCVRCVNALQTYIKTECKNDISKMKP